MAARRPMSAARRPRRQAALAAGAAGALVLAPAASAFADDAAPSPEEPETGTPAAPEIVLPTAEPEDQVAASAPSGADEVLLAADEPPVESYFGTHKVTASLSGAFDGLADNQFAITVLHDDGVQPPWETSVPLGPTDLRELNYRGEEALTFTVRDADEDYWFVGSSLSVPPCTGSSSGHYCRADFTAPLERKQRELRVDVESGAGAVAGAQVELRRLNPATGATAFVVGTITTDAAGVADFGVLPTGDYEAVVSPAPGLWQVAPGLIELPPLGTRAASLDAANAMTAVVELGPRASRLVTPVFAPTPAAAAGADLSGAVQVRRIAAGGAETTETVALGPDGRAATPLSQAAGETLELTVVDPPTGFMADRSVTLPPCSTVDGAPAPALDVAIGVPAAYRTVRVTVTAEGPPTPLDGLAVILLHPTTNAFVALGTTDASGRATLSGRVPVGTYPLAVMSMDGGPGPYQLSGGRAVEITAVDSVAEADANPQVVDVTVVPYRQREVVPVVRSADPAASGADLSSQVRITTVALGGTATSTASVPAEGRGEPVVQTAWPVTVELVTAPAGFMLPDPSAVTVEPCPLDLATACEPAEVVFDVSPAHRRVTLRALDQDGRPVPGVTMELYGPADPSPSPPPEPALAAPGEHAPVVLAAAPSTSGRPRLGGGTTSAAGAVPIDGDVRPGTGFVLVVTGVPPGYTLAEATTLVDVPAVASMADAALALDVRLTRLPVVRPPGAPRGPGGALPATGAEPGRTLALALLLGGLGAAGVSVRRRAGRA